MRVNVVSESAFTVQGHGVHTAFTETIEALKRYSDFEVVANSNERADVIHLHTVGPYSLSKLLRGGVKVVSAHVTPDSFVGSLVGAKYWYGAARTYLCWFYNRADAVLAVSDDVERELRNMGVKAKIFVVPNTIDTSLFQNTAARRAAAREKFGFRKDEFVVLAAGQVQPRKRVDTFVRVAGELKEIRFLWVGGVPFKRMGAESAAMNKLMEDPPENVAFTGVVDRRDVVEYLCAADLFFLPSIQETFGLVIVEAAASGLPIVLRDLELYRETFKGGYVAAEEDEFAGVIHKFQLDREYYDHWREMSAGIARRYDLKTGANLLVKAYQYALNSKGRRQ